MAQPDVTRMLVSVEGALARITFAAGTTNIIDRVMIGEMKALIEWLRDEETISVVLFESAVAGFFLNHLDLQNIPETRPEAPARPGRLRPLQVLVEDLRTLPQATIAVVEGRAVGFGCEFLAGCDMVFALTGGAVFAQIEVALGVIPGAYGTQGLPRLMGRRRALEMILGCQEIDAVTAERYGLVNRSLEGAVLRPFVETLARRIASFPARTIGLAKIAVEGAQLPIQVGLVHEAQTVETVFVGREAPRRVAKLRSLGAGEIEFERNGLFAALASLGEHQIELASADNGMPTTETRKDGVLSRRP